MTIIYFDIFVYLKFLVPSLLLQLKSLFVSIIQRM